MAGLFSTSANRSSPVASSALTVQQSCYATPINIVIGTNRVYGNMIWYGAFASQQVSQQGGKGGVVGGGGKGGGSGECTYTASFAISLCEGPIESIGQVFVSKQITTVPVLGGSVFTGTLDQIPWGYLTTNFPDQADGYNMQTYVGFPDFALGTSSETPQFSFETFGLGVVGSGNQDALCDNAFSILLGFAEFPSGYVGAFTQTAGAASFGTYCAANGFYISPILDQQRMASDWLTEMIATLNSDFLWANGVLTVVPYGDTPVNGDTNYVPNLTPLYSLNDDDFIVDGDEDPVTVEWANLSDAYNQQPIEYINRGDQYNLETYYAEDAAQIDLYGIRTAPTLRAHHITDPVMAQNMAYLALWRQIYIEHGAHFKFKLPWNYILVNPMDLLAISDSNLGLVNKLVRVTEIKETSDGELQFTCEDMPGAIAGPAQYNNLAPSKYTANYAAEPGNVNPPVFFEAPLAFLQAAQVEVDIGVSASNPLWGGCNIWVSTDGDSYQIVQQINGGARMGVTTADLPNFTPTSTVNNIDTINTLAVDMTQSLGSFNNAATTQDATANNSLCYVGGEFISFGSDVLTAQYKYNLSYLNRGAYYSPISDHPLGSSFVRFDASVVKYDIDQSRVGQTLYFKFQSFNVWGGGMQTLSQCAAYSYTVLGTALLTPLANPSNLAVSYTDNIAIMSWSGVADIRSPIIYEIRKGSAWASAQIIGRTLQTNYQVYGVDTFWVAALYFTPLGVPVYSAAPVSVAISAASLAQNLIEEWDEASTSWSGTCTGGAQVVGSDIVLSGNNILAQTNVLSIPNVFGLYPVTAATGTYTAPSGHTIESNYIMDAKVVISWTLGATYSASDVTAIPDVPTASDIVGAAPPNSVFAQPQIRLSQDDGVTWSAWQNWVPGVYQFNQIQYQIILYSYDAAVDAVLSDFSIEVDVPLYPASGTSTSSASTTTSVNYPITYNFAPQPVITIQNGQAGDDVVLTAQSTSGFTYEVLNSGSKVVRTVNWQASSY